MIKKLAIIMLSGLLLFAGSADAVLALQPTHEVEHVGNEFVDVQVNQDNGRFSIQTKQGHPLRMDDEESLLFYDEYPDTSFTTFRIDGKDYIFGEGYGFLGMDSGFAIRPSTQGLSNQSVWRVNGLDIIQTITLVDDVKNPNIGNVKIAYEVTNTTDQAVQVGSRILLDTMLGAHDASPIALSGNSQYIRTETDLRGSQVPAYWRAVDDPISPNVMSYGFMRGWDNRQPDRMVIAHWEGISATAWDYGIQALDFTTKHNAYGSADSAVALYWNPNTLPAGDTTRFETYYGLGSLFTAKKQATYGVQMLAPKELKTNDAQDGYMPEAFEIHVAIDNTGVNARTMRSVAVELGLPLELMLEEGQARRLDIERIEKGEVLTLIWRVKAIPQQLYKAARYWVSVEQRGWQQTIHADYVILPALSGAPPQLQLLDVLPRKKFIEQEDRELRLKGQGFSALVNNWDASIKLVRERDGQEIPLNDFTVLGDSLMQIVLNEPWQDGSPEAGGYTLQLDAGEYGRFEQSIEMTIDTQYQSRSYGLLTIVKRGTSYVTVPVANEQALSSVSGEVLLTIRGDIREIRNGGSFVYEVASGATINSVVSFDGDETVSSQFGGDSMLRVVKNGGTLELSGIGVLSIPFFPFVKGPFSIKMQDGNDYSLDAGEDEESIEVHWELADYLQQVATMSFFPVTMKHAVIGDKSVSFGGNLYLNFGDAESGSAFQMGVDLDEARFGLNGSRNFGFLGLRAEGEVGLPDDFIPGAKFGAEARVLLDTLQHIYEIEADVNFKVIETGGLLTIRFINSKFPIVDNFEFYAGGKPGIPLIPSYTVAYITKGGGGFNHLYDTLMGNFNILPPLTLVVIGGMSIGNILFADDMRLEASLRGMHFESSIAVMDFTIFDKVYGEYMIEDSLWNVGLEAKIGAEMTVFDVIEGDVSATISYDSSRYTIMGPMSMSGSGNVSLIVPRNILFVGGRKFGNVKGYIGTNGVSASGKFLGIPINWEYAWGDQYPRLASLAYMPPEASGLAQQEMRKDGKSAGMMTYGTNFSQISDLSQWTNPKKGQLTILADEGPTHLDIPVGDQDYALFEFAYSGEPPQLTLTTPSGQAVELVEDENYYIQQISAEDSQSGLLEQYVYISVVDPEPGTWKMVSDKPLDDGRLMDVAELPVIDQLTVESIGTHELQVEWQSSHAKDGMEVALYLSEDGGSDTGRLLQRGLPATGSTTVSLPDTLPSGAYHIRATLIEEDMLKHDLYSTTSFTIVNPYELSAPEQVTLDNLGNGFVHAEWVLAEEADGFVLQAMDTDGQPLQGIGMVEVAGNLREANIGGTYEDQSTGERSGLIPGETYRMEVTPYVEVGSARVYGQPAMSEALYVPEPSPANVALTIQVGGLEAKQTTGDTGEMIYIVDESEVNLVIQSDQITTSKVYREDGFVAERSGDGWQQPVTLVEGMNRIDVFSANEQGDVTISSVQVRLDREAPDLMIESPDTVISTSDPVVRVQGIAELGSIVKVNGKDAETDEDGRFTSEVSLAAYASRDITVTAADEAGNVSVYTVQAMNENVGSFERVEIRAASTEREASQVNDEQDIDLELFVDETAALELVGIDAHGDEYILHPDGMVWDVLMGGELGSVADGLLQADHDGDIVVHASYRIAEDYALQDSFSIRVNPREQTETPNYEDWYDEDWVDPYPQNPPLPRDEEETAEKEIDNLLQRVLESIIEAEQGTEFFDYIELSDGEDQVIADDDRAELKVFSQQYAADQLGVGMGKVKDAGRYFLGDRKQLVGDIYELKTNKPVQFEKPPELSIRFGLEDVEQPEKLAIYWYNESKQRWEYIGGKFNALLGTVTAQLPHFSKYALLYDEEMRRFSDMGERWSMDAVYRLSSIGVIDGWEQSGGEWRFAPEQTISRQEFIKLIVASEGVSLSSTAEIPSMYADRQDVSAWAVPYMNTANEQGWLNGSKEGDALYLNPLEDITRSEAAVILARVNQDLAREKEAPSFKDAEQVPVWAREAVAGLEQETIINGYPDGTFRPRHTIKREEAAVMILRFMDWVYLN